MTDNFKIIKDFIQSQWGGQFDSLTYAFYMVDIIGRVKDYAYIIAGNHKFKTYYIRTIKDLDKYELLSFRNNIANDIEKSKLLTIVNNF